MTPAFADCDLDVELVFDRFLARPDLALFQELLVELAPRWCRRLRHARSARDQVAIDVADPVALADRVLVGAGERGETYRALVDEHGRPPLERFVGSAELRGDGPALTVVIGVDELVVSPRGDQRQLGNRIALQIRRATLERRAGAVWADAALDRLCDVLEPAWASARHPREYWAKVMSDEPPIRAVGRDFGRWLPGIFWRNHLGSPYRSMLGDLLAAAPGGGRPVGAGVTFGTVDDPLHWDSAEALIIEQRLREHFGSDLFFSKSDPDVRGRVPSWGT